MLNAIRNRFHPLFYLRRRRWFQNLSRILDWKIFTRISGISFPVCVRLLPNISFVLLNRVPESTEQSIFRKIVERTDVQILWDIGSNIGTYSFRYLTLNPSGTVLSLEPDISNVACLQRTVRRNRLKNITIIEAAAADSKGNVPFFIDDLTGATGSIIREPEGTFIERRHGAVPKKMEVSTVTLDSLLESHPAPQMVKIDVEGAELRVLEGARSLIKEYHPILLIEISQNRGFLKRKLWDDGYFLIDADTGKPSTDDDQGWNFLALPPRVEPAILN